MEFVVVRRMDRRLWQGRRERGLLAETGMRAQRVSPGFGKRATEDAASGVEALS
jgi:hypothetical protein